MAKKYKSTKLIKPSAAVQQNHGSAFGKHANRLAESRKKKIQKLTDTQKRVMQSRKNNKMIKISKKAKKFALLDEQGEHDDEVMKKMSLTHKGVSIKDMKRFDDVNLGESDIENDDEFDDFQQKMHFAGFEATDNLLQDQNNKDDDNNKKQKSKNEVYKEIIQKSKAYKMLRQQQYEQNFNIANELDDNFDQLVGQLKFRNKDQQMLQRLEHRDLEYDKLMNELRDDERVVSNKIVEKNEKLTEKIRKKKNDQLNKLMKDSSDEEDIRGWVDGAGSDEDQEGEDVSDSGEQGEDNQDGSEGDSQQQQGSNEQQEEYDELDDVQLSSEQQQAGQGQQQVDDQQQQQQEEDGQDLQDAEQDEQQEEEEGDDVDIDIDEDEQDEQQQDDEDEDDDEQQQEQESDSYQQPVFTQKGNHNKNNNNRNNNNNNKKPSQQPQQQGKPNPQKKRKLNFVQ